MRASNSGILGGGCSSSAKDDLRSLYSTNNTSDGLRQHVIRAAPPERSDDALVAAGRTGTGASRNHLPSPPIRVTIIAAAIEPLAGCSRSVSRLRRRYADALPCSPVSWQANGLAFVPFGARPHAISPYYVPLPNLTTHPQRLTNRRSDFDSLASQLKAHLETACHGKPRDVGFGAHGVH